MNCIIIAPSYQSIMLKNKQLEHLNKIYITLHRKIMNSCYRFNEQWRILSLICLKQNQTSNFRTFLEHLTRFHYTTYLIQVNSSNLDDHLHKKNLSLSHIIFYKPVSETPGCVFHPPPFTGAFTTCTGKCTVPVLHLQSCQRSITK